MKHKVTRRTVDGLLRPLVASLGFERVGPGRYARRTGEAVGQLSFPSRLDGRGCVAFSVLVGVRFPSVSRWIDEDDDHPDNRSTVATTLCSLRPDDKRFVEWTLKTPDDWAALREPILTDLARLAVPFIERYATLDAIGTAAEAPTPPDGIIMSPERRVLLRAAICLAQDDERGAIRILDDALLERHDAPRKHRFDIEWLRNGLG